LYRAGILNASAVQILAVKAIIRICEIHMIEEIEGLDDQLQAQTLMQGEVLRK
jgi:hypothetical protein